MTIFTNFLVSVFIASSEFSSSFVSFYLSVRFSLSKALIYSRYFISLCTNSFAYSFATMSLLFIFLDNYRISLSFCSMAAVRLLSSSSPWTLECYKAIFSRFLLCKALLRQLVDSVCEAPYRFLNYLVAWVSAVKLV